MSMPDRPVKKETGQNDSLRRENEKHEKGTTFAMRFARAVAKSVLQITVGPSLVARNVEDLPGPLGSSWRSARDQAGEAGDRRFRTVFWGSQARRAAGPRGFAPRLSTVF